MFLQKEQKRLAFKAKEKRKEENMLKGSSFQLVTNFPPQLLIH